MASNNINQAVRILRQGGLVAFATETVYGLGADASNPAALEKIFIAKQRPMDHPLIVHLADVSQLPAWVDSMSPMAEQLATAYWPGPMTLIFKKKSTVLPHITGGQDTIGIRIPSHPLARELLTAWGGGIAAPSANRFGRISPTTAQAVQEELGHAVDLILDGGPCAVGVESTIIDVSGDVPVILRPGHVTSEQIEFILKHPLSAKQSNSPRVSGSLASHYAPMTPLKLYSALDMALLLKNQTPSSPPMAALIREAMVPFFSPWPKGLHIIGMPLNSEDYARDLYTVLRELDKQSFSSIVVEILPLDPAWDAVRDRLQRASSNSI